MPLTARNVAFVLGVVFLIVGVLGFAPNPIVGPTGFFVTNTMHNLVHIISGIFLLLGAYTALGPSTALKIVGIVYALVAVLGFVMMKGGDGMMFGIAMNMMDHWLHVILAIVILAAGFGIAAGPRSAA
ncbi:MAG: DUF4383 domain-containing protein [Alphaproteobacteria bacterium]|nr:DUF4383 domain-containing protein [Alphaproteobacteria bacterium]MBV9062995.1 DUF4383 domain-containing protein [Alphaproteobacteria bacterium]